MKKNESGVLVFTEEEKEHFHQWATDLDVELSLPLDPFIRSSLLDYLMGYLSGAKRGLLQASKDQGFDDIHPLLQPMLDVLEERRRQILVS